MRVMCILTQWNAQMNRADIPDNSDDLLPVWGARDIAKVINRPERATFHLLEKGLLPAKKVGGSWVAIKGKLRAAITVD
jgi:hypothetical protein